ncbi:splicing regulatory glutamine/lysine-rich protein 1 isoform X2 [Poecilia reticulata]|uniref:splicing regulatory glutamine/lysine-rich protein 1 isoform X2 n=1 Tax=Poecilia reticulata TaxID=8081 RepID=UPI0004A3D81D|nr:PREDICTED: splicing regulatory glutamine/lysine-rich protein 1 isoform X2 [Poecilia reticulata]
MVHDQYVSSTGKIPEEAKALSLLAPAAPVPSLIPGGGLLPIPTPAPLQNLNLPLVNRITAGLDPTASVLSQPPLIGNVDPTKIDEIRRTVYVGNLNSQTTTAEQLLEFFKQVGDVKFVRMAGDETQPTRFAFVEFVEQDSVARALTLNGVMFGDRPLKVNHSNNAIVKPPELTPQAAAKELESVMKRVREAQCTIAAAIEPEAKKRSSSRSQRSRRSHSRTRSRSHSRSQRKRSRSKHRPTQKSFPGGDAHSSRSGHKRRSRSRDRRHARSRSRGHKRRSKDRSRSPRRKVRSPSPKRSKREKKRERSRDRKERSTSRKRSRKDEERIKSKSKTTKDYKREEKAAYGSQREGSATPRENMTSSLRAQHNGSYKTHREEAAFLGRNATK